MKKYIFLILMSTVTYFYSCRKIWGCGPIQSPRVEGIADRKWSNGIKYLGDPGWVGTLTDTISNDTLTIFGKRVYDAIRIKFHLNKDIPYTVPYTTIQKTQLIKFQATYYINGYNSPPTEYNIDATANNQIDIWKTSETFSGNGGSPWLIGDYKLTFKLAKLTGNITTDTTRVRFTSGFFSVRLPK